MVSSQQVTPAEKKTFRPQYPLGQKCQLQGQLGLWRGPQSTKTNKTAAALGGPNGRREKNWRCFPSHQVLSMPSACPRVGELDSTDASDGSELGGHKAVSIQLWQPPPAAQMNASAGLFLTMPCRHVIYVLLALCARVPSESAACRYAPMSMPTAGPGWAAHQPRNDPTRPGSWSHTSALLLNARPYLGRAVQSSRR